MRCSECCPKLYKHMHQVRQVGGEKPWKARLQPHSMDPQSFVRAGREEMGKEAQEVGD